MASEAGQLQPRYCWRCSHRDDRHFGAVLSRRASPCLEPACSCDQFDQALSITEEPAAVESITVEPYWCWCGNQFREEEWHRPECPLYGEWIDDLVDDRG